MNIDELFELHEEKEGLKFEIFEINQLIKGFLVNKKDVVIDVDRGLASQKVKFLNSDIDEELIGSWNATISSSGVNHEGSTFVLSDTEAILMFDVLLSYKKSQLKTIETKINKVKIKV